MKKVRERAAKGFKFAERLYRNWMTMSKSPRCKYSPHAFHVSMMLNVQACPLFRSIVNECNAAEGFSANILSRSLFETALAVCFVLKKHVRIQLVKVLDGNNKHVPDDTGLLPYRITTKKPKKPDPTKNLGTKYKRTRVRIDFPSQSLRAQLYFAHSLMSDQWRFAKMAELKGIKRPVRKLLSKFDAKQMADMEAAIGPGWTYILRSSDGYSGLGIDKLSEMLSPYLYRWHRSIYGMQCKLTHGGDAPRHADVVYGKIRPVYFSGPEEIDACLHGASAMLIFVMQSIDSVFELHPIDSTIIKGLFEEFKAIQA